MNKPEASGKMLKWVIELGKFDLIGDLSKAIRHSGCGLLYKVGGSHALSNNHRKEGSKLCL